MATLDATLTLASTDLSSDNLSMTVTDSLTVGPPQQSVSMIIASTTGGNNIILPAGTAVAYVYVKHTGFQTDGTTASTDNCDVEDTDDVAFMRLAPGEFAFFPYNKAGASKGVQLQMTGGNARIEYAFFTKA
tara:strand:+ start:222 stop:617 length:396 start_codon:yes stop_codon:yes gene_type:complete